jgi:flagellar protein FliS
MTRNSANAYAKVGLETSITSASPHKLIAMLYDGALTALAKASHQMKTGDVAGKGNSISQAISIIDNGLRASLDQKGGEIAQSLDALYEYMSGRLLAANLNNQPEYLDEVRNLLKELKGAWDQIDPAAQAQAGAPELKQA